MSDLKKKLLSAAVAISLGGIFVVAAQNVPPERIEWGASLTANASTGELAP